MIASAWVSFLYGLLQVLAIWWPSIDLMPWHGFFGKRVFSTHANPNFFADFVVFTSCIIGADYFIRRKKSNLVLLGIGFITLVFSETKGAWLAFGATLVLAAAVYTNFFSNRKSSSKKLINLSAVAVLLAAIVFTGIYTAKRFQSASFRIHTWQATWEMIKDSPVLGTGPGSFKIMYPKYRHPQIFYIENAHNNETQHAENEYLEQWATGGTIGLLLFLGMFGYLFFRAYKKLRAVKNISTRLYIAGYACAIFGILVHAAVDISIHFVSSGLLLTVFTGILLALCQDNPPAVCTEQPAPSVWAYALGWGATVLVAGLAIYYTVSFYQMLHRMVLRTPGDYLLAGCAWAGWIFCVGALSYIYGKIFLKTRHVIVVLLLLLSLFPIHFFYNMFCSNHYYSVGIALIRLNSVEGSLDFFTRAIQTNPLNFEYYQYRGNIFASRLNLGQTLSPFYDEKGKPSNDYERAMRDFAVVLEQTPYHALIHQDVARLYYATGAHYVQKAQELKDPGLFQRYQQSAAENFEQARRALHLALQIDPVNVDSYVLLASMALMAHDIQGAQYWIDAYRRGPEKVTEEEFLARHKNNPKIEYLQQQLYDLQKRLNTK